MARRMLVDAAHAEETRVAVVDGNRLEEFDFETANKSLLKGNIYLATVARVEPSLQAAFVEYGGNRHGFLAFDEIHPDYYRIPVSDRRAPPEPRGDDEPAAAKDENAAAPGGESSDGADAEAPPETVGGRDDAEDVPRRRALPRYRIQEVIKRRQILLVQVAKEERGNKGAALTTYISLAGRYCVLMPNTVRGGGISRKIQSSEARKRLRSLVESLNVPDGMAVILRTAGQNRTKAEIKRDYDYLLRLWEQIRELTLASAAPVRIHEEANLIKRSIRDLYNSAIDEVLVEGNEGYRTAKAFMRTLMPSHAKRVQPWRDAMPLFARHRVESELDSMHSPVVTLPSGGYIVIDPTEALVAIDVNSGRATRERNIEETAAKTNLEAAAEIARQLRLRDLAGLVVIDFIDMSETRNARAVEKRLKEAMQSDRARIQLGRIGSFGLLELSRQRLRPSLREIDSVDCPHCAGTGRVRSLESTALHALRVIEEEGLRGRAARIGATVPPDVALYLINAKRAALADIEARYGVSVTLATDDSPAPPDCRVEVLETRKTDAPADGAETEEARAVPAPKRRGRRRERAAETPAAPPEAEAAAPEDGENTDSAPADSAEQLEGERPRRRRRGRRGGRRQTRARAAAAETADTDTESPAEPAAAAAAPEEAAAAADMAAPEPAAPETRTPALDGEDSIVRPRRRRRVRKTRATARADAPAPEANAPEASPSAPAAEDGPALAAAAGEAPERQSPEPPSDSQPAPPHINGDGPDAPAEGAAAPEDSASDAPPSPPRRGWWSRTAEASR